MTSDGVQMESVVGGARNPLNWLARAEGHMKAAELLADAWLKASQRMHPVIVGSIAISNFPGSPKVDHHRPGDIDAFDEMLGYAQGAMLHQCLAVENLLKGILIARDPERWVEANPRRLFRWTHDIRTLARAANIELAPEEDSRIDNMTRFIEWAGRYPTAMTPADHGHGASWSSIDVDAIGRLGNRLRVTLRTACSLDASEGKPR